jgi:hypothetical protein
VQLHVVEELMSAVHREAGQQNFAEDFDLEEGLELMEVQEAREQKDHRIKRPIMRPLGWIGKQQVLILVDSGSAATFISTPMVDKCKLTVQKVAQSQYTAADGAGRMISDTMVPCLQWFCQGYTFCRGTKVMNLPMYDIILGADWLEEQGPMWIDWKQKIMKFQAGDREVTLIRVKDNTSVCPLISETKLKGLLRKNAMSHWVELSMLS